MSDQNNIGTDFEMQRSNSEHTVKQETLYGDIQWAAVDCRERVLHAGNTRECLGIDGGNIGTIRQPRLRIRRRTSQRL